MDKLKKDKEEILGKNKKKTKNTSIKNKENLHSKAENLQKELIQAKEENLRYLAEIDNLRKRFDKERDDTYKYAVTEFANEIINVADNFTRVMDSISLIKTNNSDVKPLIDGVDLIFKDFLKALEKFEIKQIDCTGKKFDPNFHQAVSEQISNKEETGKILKVVQIGYLIKDRLLRPASVVVAKKDEKKK